MISGISNHKGIMFYDNSTNVAAYSYYNEEGEIVSKTGSIVEVAEMRDDDSRAGGRMSFRLVLGILIFVIPLTIIAITIFAFDEFWITAGVTTFCILASAPFLTLCSNFIPVYSNKEFFQQLRRNHGAEHTIINYQIKKRGSEMNYDLDEIRECKYIDASCSTVNSASFVIFAAVLGWSIYALPMIGLVQLGINLLVTVLLLFLNIAFNPFNPLTVFQRGNVAKPTDYELKLGIASMQAMLKKREKALKKKQTANK